MDKSKRVDFLKELQATYGTLDDQRRGLEAMNVFSADEIDAMLKKVELVNESGLLKMMAGFIVWSDYNQRCTAEALVAQAKARASDAGFPENFDDIGSYEGTIEPGQLLGKTLVLTNAAGEDDVSQALQVQRDLRDKTGVSIKVGMIMVAMGMITRGEYLQAISIQQGVAFTSATDRELIDRLAKCPI